MVLDLQDEQHGAGQAYSELYEAVGGLKRRHDLHPCAVRPRDGLALRRDGEREEVQELVRRFRDLPAEQRQRLPALLNSLAQLEVVVGDLEDGLHDFREVARLVGDPASRAEAHHNVYRAALERRDWPGALAALRQAAALDAAFEPFPFDRFDPVRVLGAGGFGVTFACDDRGAGGRRVAVLALRPDCLDRDAVDVFRDLTALQDLDHPALARVPHLGHSGGDGDRPFVVTEHVGGLSLAAHVPRHGPLTPADWFAAAWQLARALQAAHGRGVLHRGLRPGSVFLRGEPVDGGATRWRVKLLDTGLGLRRAAVHAAASNPDARARTALGRSVARVIPFAAPEVVSKPKGQVWVGPHSDVYAFGRLCAFALTGRPDPGGDELGPLPEGWRRLIGECGAWVQARRPQQFGAVLERLAALAEPGAADRADRELHEATVAEQTEALAADPGDAAALVARGNAHGRRGDHAEAAADFGRALELRPGDAALLRRRAHARLLARDLDGAVADFAAALEAEPHNLEAVAGRGLALAQRGDIDAAAADYTEAIRLSPRDGALYYNRGNAHLANRAFDRAVADYTEAVRRDPNNAWAFGNRGKAHAARGDHARAAADFGRVLQLDPGNARALADRAAAHAELGRYDRALADFTGALAREPSAGLYQDRGVARLAAGDPDGAVEDFTAALALDPEHAGAYLFRGNARADRGELDAALADLGEAVRLGPGFAPAHFHRGIVHARLGLHAEAVADFTKAVELGPEFAPAFFHRGNARAAAGDLGGAAADYDEALRLLPDDPSVLHNRGRAHARRGDYEHALVDNLAVLRLVPDDARTCNNLAWLWATAPRPDLRDPERAVEHARRALELAGHEEPGVLDTLAAALASRGDFAEAAAAQRRAVELAPEAEKDDYRTRLALYEAGKPFVEELPPGDVGQGGPP